MRPMLKFFLFLFIAYLVLCAGAYLFQRKLIFMPTTGSVPNPRDMGVQAEKVRIPVSESVELTGWWAASGESPYTLLWCHGNAGNIAHRADEFAAFARAGLRILLFDYRGYGESTGHPSAEGIKEDALAVYDFLVDQGVEGSSIIPYGRSIGSGAAAYLANRRKVAGLILVQPVTGTYEMGKHAYPFLPIKLLLREKIDNKKEVASFEGPLLILHGDRDDIVPYAMGLALFDEAGTSKKSMVTLKGGDHNNIGYTHADQMLGAVNTWLEGLAD